MAATIAGSALIATYPTAHLATGLDPHFLRLGFAAFLGTIAATIAHRTRRMVRAPRIAWKTGWATTMIRRYGLRTAYPRNVGEGGRGY
jgi:hypothetical protein